MVGVFRGEGWWAAHDTGTAAPTFAFGTPDTDANLDVTTFNGSVIIPSGTLAVAFLLGWLPRDGAGTVSGTLGTGGTQKSFVVQRSDVDPDTGLNAATAILTVDAPETGATVAFALTFSGNGRRGAVIVPVTISANFGGWGADAGQVIDDAASASITQAITPNATNSAILAVACLEGGDGNPVTATNDMTEAVDGDSGAEGGSQVSYIAGSFTPTTASVQATMGATFAVSDRRAISCIEVLGA